MAAAELIGVEVIQETDAYVSFRETYSDGSSSVALAYRSEETPPLAEQRAVIVETLAAADAGHVTLTAPNRAGLEVALATIDRMEAAL